MRRRRKERKVKEKVEHSLCFFYLRKHIDAKESEAFKMQSGDWWSAFLRVKVKLMSKTVNL